MAKREARVVPQNTGEEGLTSVKVYKRLAKSITQLANLQGTNQQTVLDRYSDQIEDELRAELTKRQTALSQRRGDTPRKRVDRN